MHLPRTAFERAGNRAATYREFVREIFDELACHRGKRFAGEKSGLYCQCLPLLNAWFPQARFVHIIRDGRDVALSAIDWNRKRGARGPGKYLLWDHEPIAAAALWWKDRVEHDMRGTQQLEHGLYHEVRYEELVTAAQDTVRAVLSYLSLAYSDQVSNYHLGKTRNESNLPSKKRWLPPTTGLRNWQQEMGDEDIALFEALAGDLLTDLGYERAFLNVPEGIRARADKYLQVWAHDQPRTQSSGTSIGRV